MKNISLLAGLLLAGTTHGIMANDDYTLALSGSILPASCEASGGETVDLKTILSSRLDADSETHWSARNLTIHVECHSPNRFYLVARDVGTGDPYGNAPEAFALGMTASGKPIGHWTMEVVNALTGPEHIDAIASSDNGASWAKVNPTLFQRNQQQWIAFHRVHDATLAPSKLSTLDMQVSVQAVFAPVNSMDLDDDADIQGQAVLELHYL